MKTQLVFLCCVALLWQEATFSPLPQDVVIKSWKMVNSETTQQPNIQTSPSTKNYPQIQNKKETGYPERTEPPTTQQALNENYGYHISIEKPQQNTQVINPPYHSHYPYNIESQLPDPYLNPNPSYDTYHESKFDEVNAPPPYYASPPIYT